MANIFLYSDPHFSHENICRFLREDGTKVRPFDNAAEMDEELVKRWNEVIQVQDKVYVLGDVVMHKNNMPILKRLNGHKRLVRGNHDIYSTKEYMKYFEDIHGVRVLEDMILSHIPLHVDSITKRFNTNVHGHLHTAFVKDANGLPDSRYHCVCVEQTDYRPLSVDEVRARIKAIKEKYPPIYNSDRDKKSKGPD